MRKIRISNKLIAENKPCFIIAEAGVNHNGQLILAKELVDAAVNANADAVKFQTFKGEDLVTATGEMADYQKKTVASGETQLEMLKRIALPYKHFRPLKKYCDQKGIVFLSTPHTEDAFEFLNDLVPAYKIASGDLTNLSFLEKIAKKRKPVILSTGMGTLKEVEEAVETIKKFNKKLILLHCTTSYPCSKADVNLKAMLTLKKEFGFLTGYSDHTLGIDVSLMAVKLGAVALEKHFTLDKNMPGPDHKASLEPRELKQMVKRIRNKDFPEFNEVILGSKEKKPTKKELRIAKVARKSIVACQNIPGGTILAKKMIEVKRPGTGIKPKYLHKIIGRVAKKNMRKNTLIKFKDLK